MLYCRADAVAKLECSRRVLILPVCGHGGGLRSTVFVDGRAIIVQLRWVLWSQRARSRSTRYLQIRRWQLGTDSSIILKFIAVRVEARGDGPLSLWPAFNSSLVDSAYDCKIRQNATLTGQERQGDVQLKVSALCFVIF